jgi:hypothetical protein
MIYEDFIVVLTAYLESDHWKGIREQAFFKYGRKCMLCEGNEILQVHHLLYHPENLYLTTVDEVRVVCKRHHDEIHELIDTKVIVHDWTDSPLDREFKILVAFGKAKASQSIPRKDKDQKQVRRPNKAQREAKKEGTKQKKKEKEKFLRAIKKTEKIVAKKERKRLRNRDRESKAVTLRAAIGEQEWKRRTEAKHARWLERRKYSKAVQHQIPKSHLETLEPTSH